MNNNSIVALGGAPLAIGAELAIFAGEGAHLHAHLAKNRVRPFDQECQDFSAARAIERAARWFSRCFLQSRNPRFQLRNPLGQRDHVLPDRHLFKELDNV